MSAWWVEFSNGFKAGCIELKDGEDLRVVAKELLPDFEVRRADRLPYPANPRYRRLSDTPSFCCFPTECRGHGSCPRNIACTE